MNKHKRKSVFLYKLFCVAAFQKRGLWAATGLIALAATAQTPPTPPLAGSNPVAPVETHVTTATSPPADSPEGCRIVTDRAMGADLRAATAQSQKTDPVALGKLLDESIGLWTLATERCTERAQERARRNLVDSQRSRHALEAQTGAGPECTSRQKDATSLQELAQQALRERRWLDASVMYRKAENMWDVASERCTGEPQRLALQRRDQTETDAHNAEFCAPTFEQAREQTQTLTRQGDGTDKTARQQQQQVAETLWRDAMTHCKGAPFDVARNNAQRLAKERGTPWVPTAPAAAPARVALAATSLAAGAPPVSGAALPHAPVSAGVASAPAAPPATGTSAAPVAPVVPVAQTHDIQAGDTRFQGQFVRDGTMLSGHGRVSWANGDVYQGDLLQSRRHGQGEFTWANGQRYKGTWVNDVPEGKGSLKFASGNQYDGDVVRGLPHGVGRMVFASGDSFQGQFLQGKPNGSGTYRWANGQTYEGPWTNDQPNGRGLLVYVNGNRYEGDLLNGTPHGKGTLIHASGDEYSGQFHQGNSHGEGTYRWKSGDRYSGQWRTGQKHGQGRFVWANGDHWEGLFEDDSQTEKGTLTQNPR